MIDVSASNLWQEAKAAEQWATDNLKEFQNQIRRYHTKAYRTTAMEEAYPENYYFSYVTHTVAQLATGEPRARVGTSKEGPAEPRSVALQYGWNRWAKDTNYKREREKFAHDMCFAWPIMLVSLKPRPGMEQADDPLTLPAIARISPMRFFWDPYALSLEDCRYMGHINIRDKDDIEAEQKADKDAGWNLEVLANLSVDAGVKELRNIKQYSEAMPARREVMYYEVIVFEAELPDGYTREEGYNGVKFTIPKTLPSTKGSTPEYLRKPQPVFCPRWGPYVVGGAYTVPDSVAPLAPLVAAEGQISELNTHVRAANRAAARRKSVALVDGLKPTETQKMVNAQDGDVVTVKGLDKSKVVEIETGGVTQEQVMWNLELRGRVDRNLGMSDAIRGQVNEGATATAESVANANSQVRSSFIQEKFSDFEKRGAKTIMWYLDQSESTVFALGAEASSELGMPGALFVGGNDMAESMRRAKKHGLIEADLAKQLVAIHKQANETQREGSGKTFDDLEVEILSIRDDGSAQASMQALGQQIIPILPMVPQTASWFPWEAWFRRLGEAYNMPDLARVDVQTAGQLFMAAQLAQAQQGQPGAGGPPGAGGAPQIGPGTGEGMAKIPRLTRDTGGSPVPGWAGPQARPSATPGGTAKEPKIRSKTSRPLGAAKT
jgi:hypothetical protein